VSTDKDHDLIHFARARELTLYLGRSQENVLLCASKAIVLLMEARGEDEAFEERFHGC
jgi:hypothetical protein